MRDIEHPKCDSLASFIASINTEISCTGQVIASYGSYMVCSYSVFDYHWLVACCHGFVQSYQVVDWLLFGVATFWC